MRRPTVILAFVLVALGLVWILQGLGILTGGSFMVGDRRWALAGVAAVVVGAVIGLRARQGGPAG